MVNAALFSRQLLRAWCAEPETEAPHLGVSSGGVEVDGPVVVRASNDCCGQKYRMVGNYVLHVSPL